MADPLLVFADDWGRHPSSCQHLVRRLFGRCDVIWVNTIGTRAPRFDLATLRRGLEKLTHWTRPHPRGEPPPDGLQVLNPHMWPWFRSGLDRRLNRSLIVNQLAPVLRSLPSSPVAVTTLPITADLVGALPVKRWVYYCVDDFGVWPGLDHAPLRRMEADLVARVDDVVAVSEHLRRRLAGMGRDSHLLTHGVDLDQWQSGEAVPELIELPRPLVVFFGVVDRRMDIAWVRRLATDLDGGCVLLAGPLADPDPELLRIPKVVYQPPLRYRQLPTLARESAVLVMPYVDEPVTRAMQPLKLKEYLAAGRPAVVRDLPANREWADCLDVVGSAEEFSRRVRQRLTTGLPDDQCAARARLIEETWQRKAELFAGWLWGSC